MILPKCENIYNDSKKLLKKEGFELLFSHFGEFKTSKINEFISDIEEYLTTKKEPKKIIKSFFNILIEGLQNIKNHGEFSANDQQLAYCNIVSSDDVYVIHFANLIISEKLGALNKAINRLNNTDYDGVKKIYLDTLTNGEISKKGGAGLGVITMAMKSKNKIILNNTPINDKLSLISIEINLNKK
ncbi:MAG: SiaB family protein kinase [Flavobacteriales bacterium]|nr:SiaB family protein kinase [Flavobacteriales bacterium]